MWHIPIRVVLNLAFCANNWIWDVERNEPHVVLYYLHRIFHSLQGVYNLVTYYMYFKIEYLRVQRSKHDSCAWYQATVTAFWSRGPDKKKRGRHTIRNEIDVQCKANNRRKSCMVKNESTVNIENVGKNGSKQCSSGCCTLIFWTASHKMIKSIQAPQDLTYSALDCCRVVRPLRHCF